MTLDVQESTRQEQSSRLLTRISALVDRAALTPSVFSKDEILNYSLAELSKPTTPRKVYFLVRTPLEIPQQYKDLQSLHAFIDREHERRVLRASRSIVTCRIYLRYWDLMMDNQRRELEAEGVIVPTIPKLETVSELFKAIEYDDVRKHYRFRAYRDVPWTACA